MDRLTLFPRRVIPCGKSGGFLTWMPRFSGVHALNFPVHPLGRLIPIQPADDSTMSHAKT